MAALDILRAVRSGRPFDAALGPAVAELSDEDRRLAHEIAAGVLRTRTALDGDLTAHVTARWSRVQPDLKDVLRIGAYQLLHLRVPDHAAVESSVELAKREVGTRAGGLVNAVLRRVADGRAAGRDGGTAAAQHATAVPPFRPTASSAEGLARNYSHPEWLVARWLEAFGADRTEALLTHNNTRPAVSLKPIRWSGERLRDALERGGVRFDEMPWGDGVRVSGVRVAELPGYDAGAFIVQDPAQARVLAFADVQPGTSVWDACAAPGGKSAVLAGTARVVASDAARERLARLSETLARTQAAATVLAADARRPPFGAAFDTVFVDAPCSATGALAKHPDARWRLSPDQITRLAALQAEILDGAGEAVRPGGRLVYITCSLEPEENERQVDQFLTRHASFARETDDLRIFPADARTDGAFAARLVSAA